MKYRERRSTSTEFLLVVECCRFAFAGGDASSIRQLAANVRWDRVLHLSGRHRVQGLVWHGLHGAKAPLPAAYAAAFSAETAAVAEQNLRAAQQSARLLDVFEAAAIPLIFIKGLTVGALAYGNPFLKMSWDVDVLVRSFDAVAAAGELERLDYELIVPSVVPRSVRFIDWHRKRKESIWRSPEGLHLELHTRLADSRDLIPGIDVGSPRQHVAIAPRIQLPTLALDELFAYLCVHGASSAWFRLKWITDLAALLHGRPAEEIERLYERSQELGAGRAAAQALLLAARVYGTGAGGELERRLNRKRVNRWLADAAWQQTLRENEPTDSRFGTGMIHLTQFFIAPGINFKARELLRQVSEAAT